METPILLLIFNRPETTQRVFDSIRSAKPKRLYISADGPRKTKAGEGLLCAEAKKIIESVDWECEVLTNYREDNLGCEKAVSSGIDWFFSHEERGIILEDDCLAHPSFYTFCEQLLAQYNDDTRVMHIGGVNFQKGRQR